MPIISADILWVSPLAFIIGFTISFGILCSILTLLLQNRKKVKRMFEELEAQIKVGIGKRLKEARGKKTLAEVGIEYAKHRGVEPLSTSIIQTYETSSAPYHYVLWVHETSHVDLYWLITGK